MNTLQKILLLGVMIGGMNAASAQETPEPNQLSQQLISERIQTLRDTGSQEGDETAIDSYQQVLNWLGEADVHAAAEKTFLEALNAAPQQESDIRARMETIDYGAPGLNPASVAKLSKAKIEDKLTAFRVELLDTSAAKDALDRRIASERSSAPDIQARLEAIDKRMLQLPTTVITIEPDIQPSQFEASQWSVLAERRALVAEQRSLEARLSSQPVRYSKRKAESDEFKLKVDGLEVAVQTLETELASRAETQKKESSISLDENAPGYEFVQQLAEENTRLGILHKELDTLLATLKEEDTQVSSKQLALMKQFDAVQQIVAIAQNSSSLGHVLMAHWHQADNFFVRTDELVIATDIGEHVIQRAEYDELQAALSKTSTDINEEPDIDEATIAAAKDQVRSQRELLTELIAFETELINVHGSIDRTHQQLSLQYEKYLRYLRSRILWVPSHAPVSLSAFNIKRESGNFVDSLSGLHIKRLTLSTSLLLVLILISFVLRKKINQYLAILSQKIGRPRDDSIRYTFRAFLLTLIQSITLPLLLFVLANDIESSGTAMAPYLALAFVHLAQSLFLILLLRTACGEYGIAPVHFGWSRPACSDIHRLTTSLLVWWWPLAFVTALVFRVEVDSVNAVFGRLLFGLNMVVLGIILSRALWPQSGAKHEYSRLRIVGLGLVISFGTFFVAASFFGYLYSAKIIYDALVNSLIMGIGLIFFYYFMQRWLLVVRRRLRFQELLAARQEIDENEEHSVDSEQHDLVTLSESISQLLKSGTLALGALGFAYLWAPLFRALEAMQRVTLWTVSDTSKGEAILTSITLASLVLALIILVVTLYAARSIPRLLALLLRGSRKITPGSRYATVKLIEYLIFGSGFIIFLSTLGLRWDRLQWLVAALSVGIGFGLQEIIANFISGLIILFERPIRVGDVITVGESSGQVIRIRIRATMIRDFDGKELLVPNKEFVTGRLLNWTLSDTSIRMTLEVGITYGSDVRKARSILEDILASHQMILDKPAPDVVFGEFGDNALILTARYFFSEIEQRAYLFTDLHQKIYDAFAEAGIVIAFPQLDVHLDPRPGS